MLSAAGFAFAKFSGIYVFPLEPYNLQKERNLSFFSEERRRGRNITYSKLSYHSWFGTSHIEPCSVCVTRSRSLSLQLLRTVAIRSISVVSRNGCLLAPDTEKQPPYRRASPRPRHVEPSPVFPAAVPGLDGTRRPVAGGHRRMGWKDRGHGTCLVAQTA